MTKKSLRLLAISFAPAAALLLALSLAGIAKGTAIGWFTKDPATLLRYHPVAGVLSNVGVVIWCSSAAISLFVAFVLRGTGRGRDAGLLLGAGILTAVLALDDFFLIHDFWAREYLGIPERLTYGILGAWTLAHLLAFRREILASEYAVLATALALFAVSVAIDAALEPWLLSLGLDRWVVLVEDGAKFLGIVAWSVYHAWVAWELLVPGRGRS